MAEIKKRVVVEDGASPVLEKIGKSAEKAGGGFKKFASVLSQGPKLGFGKAINSELDSVASKAEKTSSIFKQMLGANLVGGAISKGVGAISGFAGELGGELSTASKTWQTFQGNMSMSGMSDKEIDKTKKSLQDFAGKTIYDVAGMASTYSQLNAVGTKNTLALVKGFGGLAAASSEPVQAMKTLSTQATQMAAKPQVEWADFKLMLEQTPAGVAAIAKQMGKSTNQLVKDVQDKTVATQDFFDAVSAAGTTKEFTKMAQTYKTVGEAVDGLKENIVVSLQGAYDKFNKLLIPVVEKFGDMLGAVDFNKVADKAINFATGFAKKLGGARDVFKRFNKDLKQSSGFKSMQTNANLVGSSIDNLKKRFANANMMNPFKGVGDGLSGLLSSGASKGLEVVSALMRDFWSALDGIDVSVFDRLTTKMSLFKDSVVNLFARMSGKEPEEFATSFNVFDKIFGFVEKGVDKLATVFDKLSNYINSMKPSQVDNLKQMAKGIIEAFGILMIGKNMFSKPWKLVFSAVGVKLLPKIAEWIGNVVDWISKLEPDQLNVLTGAIKGVAGAIAGIAIGQKVLPGLLNGIGMIKTVLQNPVKSMLLTGLVLALPKIIEYMPQVIKFIQNMADKIKSIDFSKFEPFVKGAGMLATVLGAGIIGNKLLNPLKKSTSQADKLGGGLKKIFKLKGRKSPVAGPAKGPSFGDKMGDGLKFTAKAIGVATVVASLALLAKSMEGIANAGPNAMQNMATFGAVVAGLASVFALTGKKIHESAVGIAVFGASVSVMALSFSTIANAGSGAVANLATFGAVVGGLALVFAGVGSSLQASAVGIGVFAGSLSILALSMSGIANAGTGAVANMATFGIVVGGLAGIFAIFGGALNVAIPGMVAFGATMLMVGGALALATPFMETLPPLIIALGTAFITAGTAISGVVDSVFNGLASTIETIGSSISGVIDSISGGISNVLDSVAGIFEKMGGAAKNAGAGMKMTADGIKALSSLGFWDIAKGLGGIAKGMTDLAKNGEGMATLGAGMQAFVSGLQNAMVLVQTLATSFSSFGISTIALNASLSQVSSAAALATQGLMVIQTGVLSAVTSFMQIQMASSMAISGLTQLALGSMMIVSSLSMLSMTIMQSANGLMMFGSMSVIAVGSLTMFSSVLMLVSNGLMSISSNATMAGTSLANIGNYSLATAQSLLSLGQVGSTAIQMLLTVFTSAVPRALQAGQQLGMNFSTGVRNGALIAVGYAHSAVTQINGAFSSGASQAYTSGQMIGLGLANGLNSALGAVEAAASQIVSAANKAVQAKAQIHSPSRLFAKTASFLPLGVAKGIVDNLQPVKTASERMVDMSDVTVQGSFTNPINPAYGNSPSEITRPLPSQALTTNNTQSNTSSDNSVVIESGAFTITGADKMTAEEIVRQIENFLIQKSNASLA